MHHYDEIGLLEPSERSAAGYRLYAADDLRRPHRILFYRELGFDLTVIATMLADTGTTDEDRLRHQTPRGAGHVDRGGRAAEKRPEPARTGH